MQYEKKYKNVVLLFIFLSGFYFNFLPYIIRLNDIYVKSGYYNLENNVNFDLIFLSFLNIIYFFLLCFLFYIFLSSIKKLKKEKNKISFLLYFFLIITSVYLSYNGFALSRFEIKESSTLLKEIIINTTLTILSFRTITTKYKLEIFINFILVIYFSITVFEREILFYFVVPILLRYGIYSKNLKYIFLTFVFFTTILFGYKNAITLIKNDFIISTNESNKYLNSSNLGQTFGKDSIHKLSLELSYLDGNHPDYNNLSMIAPYQFLRIFDSELTTNGRLATRYYTNNKTGTGFSSILEGYLNFSFLFFILLPIIYISIFRLCLKFSYLYMVTPFIIFMIKISRSDFWPLFLSSLILPMLFLCLLFNFSSLINKFIPKL